MDDPEFILYVWGGAPNLLSIDAGCLATVTYLRNVLPRDMSKRWQIVACNDPTVAPSNLLPALKHDTTWVTGHRPITRYLSTLSQTPSSHAISNTPEIAAFSAYLSHKASLLIDLSLYVSHSNWTEVTRPLYSTILPWPLTWAIPPSIRQSAIQRVERAGFSGLDIDDELRRAAYLKKIEKAGGTAKLPETFRWKIPFLGSVGVLGEMTVEAAAGIRLVAFAKGVLTMLSKHGDLFWGDAEKRVLGPEGAYVYALLKILLELEVPQGWLRELIEVDYPQLREFVDIVDEAALKRKQTDGLDIVTKVWDLKAIAALTAHQVLLETPFVSQLYLAEWRREVLKNPVDSRPRWPVNLLSGGLAVISTGLAIWYVMGNGRKFGREMFLWEGRSIGLQRWGAVGSMLGAAMGGAGVYRGGGGLAERRGVIEDISIDL